MIPFPQLIFYMAGRITCTCGCGLEVTYATKRNHLNAGGGIHLRSRVVSEARSWNRNTQQQKPAALLQRGVKKRASSNADQDGSRKRRKEAQLDQNQLPESHASFQVDTDLVEDLVLPVVKDADRQSRFIERSHGVMEMRWTTSRRDGVDGRGRDKDEDEDEDEKDKDGDGDEDGMGDEDGDGDGDDDEDEDEDEDGDGDGDDDDDEDEDEDDEDEDDEDEDEDEDDEDDDEDEDEDEPPFYASEIPGISNLDLLGEDFEREAAALGLYSLYELPT
jgi:hypothetical protein